MIQTYVMKELIGSEAYLGLYEIAHRTENEVAH